MSALPAFTLTADQQAAKDAFTQFFLDPLQNVFVLAGYSGTGKTTLVRQLLEELPKLTKTQKLIDPSAKSWEVELSATTNKAAEALSNLSGHAVRTIHSLLGLRVQKDYNTGETYLTVSRNSEVQRDKLIFIDEASFIDQKLLNLIFKQTKECKLVFMGDPAQLTPVKSSETVVFSGQYPGVEMRQVVRHDGPILELATKFRGAVETGEFFQFVPDGHHVRHVSRSEFGKLVTEEFTRADWRFTDSKILAWTNNRAVEYNQAVNELLRGDPLFQPGDYATVNSYVSMYGLKTDQTVQITDIRDGEQDMGFPGYRVELNHKTSVFMPLSLAVRRQALKHAEQQDNHSLAHHIDSTWVDLRAVFAQTIDKSQGSTYDRVFIDLDDIKKCTNGNQIARLLYVGVSRARAHVYLTGDLV